MRKQILLFLLLVCGIGSLRAQVEYGVELDTNYMLIGDQQHLTFKVRCPEGVRVVFPQLKDTVVRGMEIISGPVRDSVREDDGQWLLQEQYVVTAFDTGVYVIPSLPITIETGEFNNVLRTEKVGVAVNTYVIDPQQGNYDIVMPYAAPWSLMEILPYLLWGILGVAVLGGGFYLWWRYKKNKPLFAAVPREVVPPYVQAIQALDSIKEEKLWQPGQEKLYYTRLTDAVRSYLDGEFHISAMEQTSTEILQALKGCEKILPAEREKLENMLTTADFVKFAKWKPLQDENVRYLDAAYDFVRGTHERLESETVEKEGKTEGENHSDN